LLSPSHRATIVDPQTGADGVAVLTYQLA
jgi:hypothetical protein